ncbi:hypothetical protein [Holophaga foetida]|uniref:hypothetical protein n=1 Tax=Holophaga foetida TaxID=35839 RepID=UPI0002475017|nr:hypothetical protein [Holophaga foetida]
MKMNNGQAILDKLNAAMDSMSREELVKVVKEAIARADEVENSSMLLATHLKVLCHKNGGTLTYTKDDFEAAAKEDQAFDVEYGTENKKETCFLRLSQREKSK